MKCLVLCRIWQSLIVKLDAGLWSRSNLSSPSENLFVRFDLFSFQRRFHFCTQNIKVAPQAWSLHTYIILLFNHSEHALLTCLPLFPGRPVGPLFPASPGSPFGPISPWATNHFTSKFHMLRLWEVAFQMHRYEFKIVWIVFLTFCPSIPGKPIAPCGRGWQIKSSEHKYLNLNDFLLQPAPLKKTHLVSFQSTLAMIPPRALMEQINVCYTTCATFSLIILSKKVPHTFSPLYPAKPWKTQNTQVEMHYFWEWEDLRTVYCRMLNVPLAQLVLWHRVNPSALGRLSHPVSRGKH